MELDNIEQLLYDELSDTALNSNTIMINGDWGIGKTYCVNNFIKFVNRYNEYEVNLKDIKKNYNIAIGEENLLIGMIAVRVSLFGKKSTAELNQELITSLNIGTKLGRSIYKGVGKILGSVTYQGVSIQLPDLPFLTENLTKGIEKKKTLGSRILIFFDDLERITDPNLLIDVLGYIENLSTKSGVNIIIACNEKELLKHKQYTEYKEKVVDTSFNYNKPSQKSIIHFIGEYKKYHNDNLLKYITNLRTLHKTTLKMKAILKRIKGIDNEEQIVNELFVRLFFCVLEQEEKYFSKICEDNDRLQTATGKKDDFLFGQRNKPEVMINNAVHECASLKLNDNYWGGLGKSVLNNLVDEYIQNKEKVDELVEYVDRQISNLSEKGVEPYYLNDVEKTEYFKKFYEKMLASDGVNLEDLCEINDFVEKYNLPIKIDNELFIQRAVDEAKNKFIDVVDRQLYALSSMRIDKWATQSELVNRYKQQVREGALSNSIAKMVDMYNAGNYEHLSLLTALMVGEHNHKSEPFEAMLEANNMFFPFKHRENITDHQNRFAYKTISYLDRNNKKLLGRYLDMLEGFMADNNADNTDRVRTKHLLDSFVREIGYKDYETLKESIPRQEPEEQAPTKTKRKKS